MATTPNPLIWDFSRQVGSADGLGGVVHYYDEESQTLYLEDGNLKTRTAIVEDGHWSSSVLGNEVSITADSDFTMVRFDHPINGTLYGAAISNGSLIFLRYVYAYDLTNIVTSFDLTSQSDSPIDQLSISIQNIGSDIFGDSASLFNPGAKIPIRIKMGNSELYSLGISWVDEIDYSVSNEDVSISGRNSIGYFLKDQTFDGQLTVSGTSKQISEYILNRAGIKKFEVQNGSQSRSFTFQPETTLLSGLDDISNIYTTDSNYEDYGMLEMTDGKIIIGSTEWRSSKLSNSRYTFNVGKDVFARNTTKNADAAYSNLRTTGKIIVTEFSTTNTYAVGDCVTFDAPSYDRSRNYSADTYAKYESKIYVCRVGISREWNGNYWTLIPEPGVTYENTAQYSKNNDYSVGDYVKYNNQTYQCIQAIDRSWKSSEWRFIGNEADIYQCKIAVIRPGNFTGALNWDYRGNDDLEPIFTTVNTFNFWALGEHRTKHLSAPYAMTPAQFTTWTNQQKEALQYTGIIEKFTGPFRPQLLVGDIAEIVDGEETLSLGIITEIKHSFSRTNGFKTDFTVDSGGVQTDGAGYVIYSKSARVNGYNRKQRISDLVKLLSKK